MKPILINEAEDKRIRLPTQFLVRTVIGSLNDLDVEVDIKANILSSVACSLMLSLLYRIKTHQDRQAIAQILLKDLEEAMTTTICKIKEDEDGIHI